MGKKTEYVNAAQMETRIQLFFRNALVSKSGMTTADSEVVKAIAERMGYDTKKLKALDITLDSVNRYARGSLRDRWYGNVEQELNRKAGVMLAEGKITQAKHDEIVAENNCQKAK